MFAYRHTFYSLLSFAADPQPRFFFKLIRCDNNEILTYCVSFNWQANTPPSVHDPVKFILKRKNTTPHIRLNFQKPPLIFWQYFCRYIQLYDCFARDQDDFGYRCRTFIVQRW